jgi:hypothetical protein
MASFVEMEKVLIKQLFKLEISSLVVVVGVVAPFQESHASA